MKKLLLPISICIDIISMCLVTFYILNLKNDTTNTIFLCVYMLFILIHITDKIRKNKLKKGMEKFRLNRNSDIYYYISVAAVLLFDIFIIYRTFNGKGLLDYITILIIFYLSCIINYDVNYLYYNKNTALYSSKKIDLKGIEKMVISKKFFSLFLTVYYKKHESIVIKAGHKTLLEIREFLEKRKKK